MAPALRWSMAVAGALVFAFASAGAWRMGMAEALAYDASRTINEWSSRPEPPGLDLWLAARADLTRAQSLAPDNPAVHESLGLLYLRRESAPDFQERALVHLTDALERRPTSPYSWASYAAASYALGRTGEPFRTSLRHAALLGPSEAEVQSTVAHLGLAVWDEVPEGTRSSIEGALARGMARDPAYFLRIGVARGRLSLACRHLSRDDPRLPTIAQARACQEK